VIHIFPVPSSLSGVIVIGDEWKEERERVEVFRTFNPSERPITSTDVKQYVYCPLWFTTAELSS